jgi:Na+/proline symporter
MPTPQLVLVAALVGVPIRALMWVSSYAKHDPELFGMPFFYWYQFVWVFVTAILTSIAYRIVATHERRRRRLRAARPDDRPDQ